MVHLLISESGDEDGVDSDEEEEIKAFRKYFGHLNQQQQNEIRGIQMSSKNIS